MTNARDLKLDVATGLPILQQDHSLLPVVSAMLGSPLRVLDFGGGAGIDFNYLYHALAQPRLRYTVVELPALCSVGRALWCDDERIEFRDDLPDGGERFDLVYSWSAVHYHPQPFDLLKSFARYQPKAILIAHTHMTSRDSFVRGQISDGGTFPCWVLSIGDINRVVEESHHNRPRSTITTLTAMRRSFMCPIAPAFFYCRGNRKFD
jgi:putative methyltransferase (TIGR04325 family)